MRMLYRCIIHRYVKILKRIHQLPIHLHLLLELLSHFSPCLLQHVEFLSLIINIDSFLHQTVLVLLRISTVPTLLKYKSLAIFSLSRRLCLLIPYPLLLLLCLDLGLLLTVFLLGQIGLLL